MRVLCDVGLCKHKRRSVWMEERASEQIGSSPINGPSHLQPLLSTVGDTERGHITAADCGLTRAFELQAEDVGHKPDQILKVTKLK